MAVGSVVLKTDQKCYGRTNQGNRGPWELQPTQADNLKKISPFAVAVASLENNEEP
jgi:hypothetical protein